VVRRLPGFDLVAGIDSESARAQFDQLLAGWLQLAGSSLSAPNLSADLSLDLGAVELDGRGTLRLESSGSSRELVLELSGGSLDLTGLGLGRISDVNGILRWSSPSADPTVVLTASSGFNGGDVQLGGTLALRRDSSTGQLWQLSGSGLSLRAGDPRQGPSLQISNGTLTLPLGGSGSGQLSVSGDGSLDGFPGVNLTDNLTYSRQDNNDVFTLSAGSLTLPEIVTLQGALTLQREQSSDAFGSSQRLWIGLDQLGAQLQQGPLSLDLSQARGGLLLQTQLPAGGGAPIQQQALQLEGTVRLQLGSSIDLQGSAVQLSFNSGPDAVSGVAGGRPLELSGGQNSLKGTWQGTVAAVGRVAGDLSVQQRQVQRETSDGRWLEVVEVELQGNDLDLAVTGPNGGGSDWLQLRDSRVLLVQAQAVAGGDRWLSASVQPGLVQLAGQSPLAGSTGRFSLNSALDANGALLANAPVLSWRTPLGGADGGLSLAALEAEQRLTLPGSLALAGATVAGDLTLVNSAGAWSLQLANGTLALSAEPVQLQVSGAQASLPVGADGVNGGTLAGQVSLSGLEGVSLSGQASVSFSAQGVPVVTVTGATLALDGVAALTGDLSLRRISDASGDWLEAALSDASASLGSGTAGVRLNRASLALLLGQGATGAGSYAIQGQALGQTGVPAVALEGFAQHVSISASTAQLSLVIRDEPPQHAVSLVGADLTVAGVGTLQGDFTMASSQRSSWEGHDTTQVSVAVDRGSLSGVQLGSLTVSMTGINGAVVLNAAPQGSSQAPQVALQLSGSATLSGLDGVSITASAMELAINLAPEAISAEIPAAEGWRAVELAAQERRLRGAFNVVVDNVLSLSGAMAVESRSNRTITLTPVTAGGVATTAVVDQLVLSGQNLALLLGDGGAAAALDALNGVLVISTETGGARRRWLSFEGSSGSGSLGGFSLGAGEGALLALNQALTPVAQPLALASGSNTVVPNWSATPLSASLGAGGAQLALSSTTPKLTLDVSTELDLGGPRLSGAISASLVIDGNGQQSWHLAVSNGALQLSAGDGPQLSIVGASGTLVLASDGSRSGSLSGNAALSGVPGLGVAGTLTASFGSDGQMRAAGALRAVVDGFGEQEGQFNVERLPQLLALPRDEQITALAGAAATVSQLVDGGSGQGPRYTLQLSSSPQLPPREGLYRFSIGQAQAQVSSLDAGGTPLGDAALASAIQVALEALQGVGSGNLSVSGSRSAGFVLQFAAALASEPPQLVMEAPADPGATASRWLQADVVQASASGRSELQLLTLNAPATGGGSFTLSLHQGSSTLTTEPIALLARTPSNERLVLTLKGNSSAAGQLRLDLGGQTSVPIRLGTGPLKTQNDLKAALEGLVGAGNVNVVYQRGYTGHDSIDYLITFQGGRAAQNIPDLSVSATTSAVTPVVKVLQQGGSGQTVAAQAAAIQTALERRLGPGSVQVSWSAAQSDTSNSYRLSFGGSLANQNLAQLTAAVTANGAASVIAATATDGAAAQAAIQTLRPGAVPAGTTVQLQLTAAGQSNTTAAIAATATAEQVRLALLAATNSSGARLGASGAELTVTALSSGGPGWQLQLGGTLSGQTIEPLRAQLSSPIALGQASLTLSQAAVVHSARHQLSGLGAGLFKLALGGRSGNSTTLDGGSLNAAALRSALEGLDGLGSGSVAVSSNGGGTYTLDFQGALAAQSVEPLQVLPVQRFSLLQADGQRAGSVSLRLGSDSSWGNAVALGSLSPAEVQALLSLQLAALPSLGLGAVALELVDAATWTYELVGDGVLRGAALPSLQLLLSRTDTLKSETVLLGASGVSGRVGSSQAGVALSNGELGLLISTDATGQSGYALQGSGTAVLQGFDGLVSLQANARLRVNTLGKAVQQTIATGPAPSGGGAAPSLNLSFADGVDRQELLIDSGTIAVAGVASLSGKLALEQESRVENGSSITDLRFGLADVGGSLSLGALSPTLSSGRGALVLRSSTNASGQLSRQWGLQAEGNLSLTGVAGLSLSLNDVRLGYSSWDGALQQSVLTPSGIYALSLVPGERRFSGRGSATINDVLSLQGDLFVESRPGSQVLLSDGTAVSVNQTVIGGSHLSANLGPSSLGLGLDLAGAALVLNDEVLAAGSQASPRRWITSQGGITGLSLAGYRIEGIDSGALNLNRALSSAGASLQAAALPVIIWSTAGQQITLADASGLALNAAGAALQVSASGRLQLGDAVLGGDFSLALENRSINNAAAAPAWVLRTSRASLGLESGGAFVGLRDVSGERVLGSGGQRSGSLSGAAVLSGVEGLELQGNLSTSFDSNGNLQLSGNAITLALSGFGSVSGSISLKRGSDGSIELAASNVSANLGPGGSGAAGVALTGGSLGLILQGRSSSEAGYALVATGTASLAGFSGVTLTAANAALRVNTTGEAISSRTIGTGNASTTLAFASAARVMDLRIGNGSVAITGLGSVSGDLAISSVVGAGSSELRIGIDNLSGSVGLAGNTFSLSGGRGAVLLERRSDGSTGRALQAEAAVSFNSGSDLSLNATRMEVAWNDLGRSVSGLTVPTGSGSTTLALQAGEKRVRGQASIQVGADLQFSGDLYLESVSGQTVALAGGGSATVDQLRFGGSGLGATVGAGGVGISLSGLNLGGVLATGIGSSSGGRWLAAGGSVSSVTLPGSISVSGGRLNLNRRLDSSGAVVNWSSSGLPSLAATATLELGFDQLDLSVAGVRLHGGAQLRFDAGSSASTADDRWRLSPSNLGATVAAGPVSLGFSQLSGSLVYGPTGLESGTLSGSLGLSGSSGVSMSGTAAISFSHSAPISVSGNAQLSLSGSVLSGDFAAVLPSQSDPNLGLAFSNAAVSVDAGSGRDGVRLAGSGISGAVLLTAKGSAGRFSASGLAISQRDGSAIPGLVLGPVRSASLAFNTTGEAISSRTIGGTTLAFTAAERQLLEVAGDPDVGVSSSAAAFTLGGNVRIRRDVLALVPRSTPLEGFVVTMQNASSDLRFGDPSQSSGARLRLGGIGGEMVIAKLDGRAGASGDLTIGSAALTQADGVTPLVAGLALNPVDLPLRFNLFELNSSFPLQLLSPQLGWPTLALPKLGVAFPDLNVDWPNLSLPELLFKLPQLNLPGLRIDLDLARLLPSWPQLKLPDLAAHFPSLGLDWPNLTLPELIDALPRLGLPGLMLNLPTLAGLSGLNWPSLKLAELGLAFPDLKLDWPNLSLPQLIVALPQLKLPGLDLDLDLKALLPQLLPFNLPLANLKLPQLGLALPSLAIDWSAPSLGQLLQGLVGLRLPGVSLSLPELSGVDWSSWSLDSLAARFPSLNVDWPNLTLPQLLAQIPNLQLPGVSFSFDQLQLPNWPSLRLDLPDLGLKALNLAFPNLNLDWPTLSLPELVLALKGLNLPGVTIQFDPFALLPDWINANLSLPELRLADLGVAFPNLGLDWGNLTLPQLVLALPQLNLPGLSFTVPTLAQLSALRWPDLPWKDLGLAFPDLKVNWSNLTLPDLLRLLPQLKLPGFELNLNLGGLMLPSFSLCGDINLALGSGLSVAGEFCFDRRNGQLLAIANNASATVAAGGVSLGVSNVKLGLVADNGGLALEGRGDFAATLAEGLNLAANDARVFFNSTGRSWSNVTINADDGRYTFGNLAATD